MLPSDLNVEFIRTKIDEIKSALFSNVSENAFRFPTCIISAIKVDTHGHIWFLMNKEGRFIPPDVNGFPAELLFYRKGHHFSLKVTGVASIVTDQKMIDSFLGLDRLHDVSNILLVNVKMSRADYTERSFIQARNWVKKIWTKIEAFIYPLKYRKEFTINLSSAYETIPY